MINRRRAYRPNQHGVHELPYPGVCVRPLKGSPYNLPDPFDDLASYKEQDKGQQHPDAKRHKIRDMVFKKLHELIDLPGCLSCHLLHRFLDI